jgi:hypothetical protein
MPMRLRKRARLSALIAGLAVAGGLFLAAPGTAGASVPAAVPLKHNHPQACVQAETGPGGNGGHYKHIATGVYVYTLTGFKSPGYHAPNGKVYSGGVIYVGKGILRNRRNYWVRFWHYDIERGVHFTWHVLARDWDIDKSGATPGGLTVAQIRAGAEQYAMDKADSYAKTYDAYMKNKINAISDSNPHKEKWVKAGGRLFGKQLENNEPAGNDEDDGDPLNSAQGGSEGEIDGNYMDMLPGYGLGGC